MKTARIILAIVLLSPVFAALLAVMLALTIIAIPCALIVGLAVWLELIDLSEWKIVRSHK